MIRTAPGPFILAVCAMLSWGSADHAALGADVPFVPTPPNVVEAMLALGKVGPHDFLVDLGSGDGRIVIAAAKRFGTRGFGVDIDGVLVSGAQHEAQRQGVSDKVAFYTRNLFVTDISRATVITMYLFPQVNMRLRPRFFTELKPGTRIVSHDFDMDSWRPDDRITVPVPDKPYGPPRSEVYLWIVPENAAGTWRWRLGAPAREHEVTLEQTFQMLGGEATMAGQRVRVENGRMRGEAITFTLVARFDGRDVRHEFAGRLAGEAISGTVTVHASHVERLEWNAVRAARGKINIEASAFPAARRLFIAQEKK
jgi:histone methylation protein DOT1